METTYLHLVKNKPVFLQQIKTNFELIHFQSNNFRNEQTLGVVTKHLTARIKQLQTLLFFFLFDFSFYSVFQSKTPLIQ